MTKIKLLALKASNLDLNLHLFRRPSYSIFIYLHSLYTVNIFLVTIVLYFSKKFSYIAKQVAGMSCSNEHSKKRFNRRLAAMIQAYNAVHKEMQAMNKFFSFFIGFCLVHFFFLVILVGFCNFSFKVTSAEVCSK